MIKTPVGIDKIAFFTSPYYVDMAKLAVARNEDPDKYLIGIGQKRQAVIPATQDVVTLAANAANQILSDDDKQQIDMILFGTETGIDNSKSTAVYLQSLLQINPNARTVEIKQACYGATAGLMMGLDHIRVNRNHKVLVIGADIARYGIGTSGEVTQGGGAVVMLLAENPRILEIDKNSSFYSKNIMDFWRPLYKREAVVDGHYSTEVYLDFLKRTSSDFFKGNNLTTENFAAFCFHLPYTKLGKKAFNSILANNPVSLEHKQELTANFEASRLYNALVGNLYTGSLYLSLISLIANGSLPSEARVGLFSYGSGASGEFFSGKLAASDHVREQLRSSVDTLLNERTELSISQYEKMYLSGLPLTNGDYQLDVNADKAQFVLSGRIDDKLIYLARK